ncbi:MAG: ribosome maturation factor RimM [Solirubrobacteraceae bacterium]
MRWLHAGRVGRPHGLDGSFYISDPTPQLLAAGRTVFVASAEREIVRRAGTDGRPIVRLAQIEDRPSVEALRGEELLCPRDAAPELDEDEWWAEDLARCRVIAAGRPIGQVNRLVMLPSCEALAVERGDGEEVLVPLVSDAVRRVDIDCSEIEIDLEFVGAGLEGAPAPQRAP